MRLVVHDDTAHLDDTDASEEEVHSGEALGKRQKLARAPWVYLTAFGRRYAFQDEGWRPAGQQRLLTDSSWA